MESLWFIDIWDQVKKTNMCGRFSIDLSPGDAEIFFKVKVDNVDFKPRYNVAPSQITPVILNTEPDVVNMVRWGLKPAWFNPKRKDGLINVRAETLKEKSTFKSDLEKSQVNPTNRQNLEYKYFRSFTVILTS